MLASLLYTEVSGKLDAGSVPMREANAQRAQAYHSRRECLMSSSSRDLEAPGKLDAVFSYHFESSQNTCSKRDRCNESGNRVESSVHSVLRIADQAKVGKSLLDGNKDHLLNQARSELMKQEHQVGSLNNCIDELQKQAHAQRLELEDRPSRILWISTKSCPTARRTSYERKGSLRYSNPKRHEMGEMKRVQELRVDDVSVQKLRESHETIQRLTSQMQDMQRLMNSMRDSGEFQEVESSHSGRLSCVPSQPATLPSYRSMLSRDKRVPLDTWNTSGLQENVFWKSIFFFWCAAKSLSMNSLFYDTSCYWIGYRETCRKKWRSK